MPEASTPTQMRSLWINLALVGAVVIIFVLSFALAPKPTDGSESFGGTDSVVTEVIEEEGYQPWFQPIFEPGSGEIESGLFALQAALGAGALGYVLGNLRGRAKERALAQESTPEPDAARSSKVPLDTEQVAAAPVD